MSNPTVSFRISDYHLARGLRAIRILEPNWELTTPANLIRTIFNDYIAKSEHFNNTSLDVPPELLQEIALSRAGLESNEKVNKQLDALPQLGKNRQPQKTAQQIARELEEERIFNEMRRESLAKLASQEKLAAQEKLNQQDTELDEQINLAFKASNKTLTKPSEFHDPNITDSIISSVTDFSPPKEWKE